MPQLTHLLPSTARRRPYCAWIRSREQDGSSLVMVWIDPAMSIFESDTSSQEPLAQPAPSDVSSAGESLPVPRVPA